MCYACALNGEPRQPKVGMALPMHSLPPGNVKYLQKYPDETAQMWNDLAGAGCENYKDILSDYLMQIAQNG